MYIYWITCMNCVFLQHFINKNNLIYCFKTMFLLCVNMYYKYTYTYQLNEVF